MAAFSWNDEHLEQREDELSAQRNALGQRLASERRFWARISAAHRQNRSALQEELIFTLGRLAEIREVRRALLGLEHNTHIRGRALPNFVADNPGYAQVVADEVPAARAVAEHFSNGVPLHE